MYGYEFIRESDLTHHGIKGQKWGQRRFQNDDGTWTAAGKERYGGTGNDVASTKAAYRAAKKDYNKSFNNAYYHNHPYSFSKKKREESQRRWDDAADKAERLRQAKSAYKDAKKNDPEHQKKVANLKKAAKIGAVVAGTALVAYGGYKLNKALNSEVGKHYKELGDKWYNAAGKSLIRAEGYAGGGFHNPNKSSVMNTSEKFERAMAKEEFARAREYAAKARQGTYSTREKAEALKRMVRRR